MTVANPEAEIQGALCSTQGDLQQSPRAPRSSVSPIPFPPVGFPGQGSIPCRRTQKAGGFHHLFPLLFLVKPEMKLPKGF